MNPTRPYHWLCLLCALSGALLVHHGTVQDKDTSSDTSRTAS